MSQTAADVYELARDYLIAWKDGDWDKLRRTLAPDVRLEDPTLGLVTGAEAHVALYRDHIRFPALDEVVLLRLLSNADAAIACYDVYLSGRRHTVFDQISVENGLITRILSATANWPPIDR